MIRRMGGVKAVFVAGTDTGAGKTVVTGLLSRYLIKKGYRAVTQKWVQTGSAKFSHDIDTHLRLMKRRRKDFNGYLSFMSPYIFDLASSPHLAARLEKGKIDINKIRKYMASLSKNFDIVIIEGTGGLLVPLNKKILLIDVIRRFRLPALLVVENKLGAINHALLSIEALIRRGIKIIGLIFNNTSEAKDRESLILKDNPLIVKALTDVRILGALPFTRNIDFLYRRFTPIGDKIMARL